MIIGLLADTSLRVGEMCGLVEANSMTVQDRHAFLRVRGKGSAPSNGWCR